MGEAGCVVVGIDEAGYGPVLGPLVVTAVGFSLPFADGRADLWQLFRRSVRADMRSRDSRIAVADSKRVYRGREDFAALERSALVATSLPSGEAPRDLIGLLSQVAPHAVDDLASYPWYRGVNPPLPLEADAAGVRLAAAAWRREAAELGVEPLGVWCEPLLEGHFNRLVRQTRNKAVVSLGLVLRAAARAAAGVTRPVEFLVDRQGGREHYRDALLRAFDRARLTIVEEGPQESSYRLRSETVSWRMTFCVGGESRYFVVALASLVSKYVRELFMRCFNDYWQRHNPGLAPTAGYYTDGQRFLRDIAAHADQLGIDHSLLVRMR